MNPVDYELKLSRAFNKRTGRLSKELITKEKDRIKKALSLSDISKNSKVLLLGVGTGAQLDECKRFTKFVKAIDLNARRRDIQKFDLNSGRLPFGSNSFDIVFALEIVEHLFYPNFVLNEIHRILKWGGQAIFSFPNEYTLINKIKFILDRQLEEHGFDTYGHHFLINEKNATAFLIRKFTIEKREKLKDSRDPLRNFNESVFFKCIKK